MRWAENKSESCGNQMEVQFEATDCAGPYMLELAVHRIS